MRINKNNYVDKAEKVIQKLVEDSKQKNRGKVNIVTKYSLQGTTQGNGLTGGVPPVRFSM